MEGTGLAKITAISVIDCYFNSWSDTSCLCVDVFDFVIHFVSFCFVKSLIALLISIPLMALVFVNPFLLILFGLFELIVCTFWHLRVTQKSFASVLITFFPHRPSCQCFRNGMAKMTGLNHQGVLPKSMRRAQRVSQLQPSGQQIFPTVVSRPELILIRQD